MNDSPPHSASSYPGSGTSLEGERIDEMLDVSDKQAEIIEVSRSSLRKVPR
jgi:hypothetical protein